MKLLPSMNSTHIGCVAKTRRKDVVGPCLVASIVQKSMKHYILCLWPNTTDFGFSNYFFFLVILRKFLERCTLLFTNLELLVKIR